MNPYSNKSDYRNHNSALQNIVRIIFSPLVRAYNSVPTSFWATICKLSGILWESVNINFRDKLEIVCRGRSPARNRFWMHHKPCVWGPYVPIGSQTCKLTTLRTSVPCSVGNVGQETYCSGKCGALSPQVRLVIKHFRRRSLCACVRVHDDVSDREMCYQRTY